MIIKRNIIFSLEKRKKNDLQILENLPIRVRIIYAGERLDMSTGYRVDLNKWDEDKQRVKPSTTNKLKQSASEINASLIKMESVIQDIFKIYEVKEEIPSLSVLKGEINAKIKIQTPIVENKTTKINFFETFNQFLRECAKEDNWAPATIKKYTTLRNNLEKFDKRISLDSFDHKKLDKYLDYLVTKHKYKNTTLEKHLKFLKRFLKWGVGKKYITNDAYKDFFPKIKKVRKKVIFLTKSDIDKIKNFQIPDEKQYLERVRDVLIFSCFSGLRYSDLYALSWDDMKSSSLEFVTEKTDDKIIVELNDHTRAIIEKYRYIRFPKNKVLPVISNQKYNDYLKELGELVGFNDSIKEVFFRGNERIEIVKSLYSHFSSHIGRRSFICNGLYMGIPVHIMMKWTGHSDYDSMRPYIDTVDSMRSKAMETFNKM
ncbi:site-specific integrase [Sphingobacterium hotanense]|uniref:Site-specific integrase n=1 Tax=Sphingobacterium hotanense TaxID=649196 RepID=A0ABT7NRY5_9SPHI|nr:site-specific integrase [Sphingobacterium hotanense]MDM1050007.1 site-specific integrase [Sphingobacterium hotanense]